MLLRRGIQRQLSPTSIQLRNDRLLDSIKIWRVYCEASKRLPWFPQYIGFCLTPKNPECSEGKTRHTHLFYIQNTSAFAYLVIGLLRIQFHYLESSWFRYLLSCPLSHTALASWPIVIDCRRIILLPSREKLNARVSINPKPSC